MDGIHSFVNKTETTFSEKMESLGRLLKELNREGRGWILLTLAVGWMMVLGVRLVFPALLPQIIQEYNIGNTVAGLIITGIGISTAFMQFPSGVIGDRVGERRILVVSILLVVVGLVTIALFPLFYAFLLGCILFGLGMGIYGTPRVMVLSNVYPKLDGTAIGITFSAGHLGTSLLPFIATLVALYVSWRVSFLMFVPVFVMIAVGLYRFLPKSSRGSTTSNTQMSYRELLSGLQTILTIPSIVFAFLGLTLWGFTFTAITTFLPIYLITDKQLSQPQATLLYSMFFVAGLFAQLAAGSVADRIGYKPVLVGLSAFSILPLVALLVVDNVIILLIVVMLIGSRLGLVAVNNAYAVAAVPTSFQGTGYGFIRTGEKLLGALGAVVMGIFTDMELLALGFVVMAILTVVMTIMYALLSPEK